MHSAFQKKMRLGDLCSFQFLNISTTSWRALRSEFIINHDFKNKWALWSIFATTHLVRWNINYGITVCILPIFLLKWHRFKAIKWIGKKIIKDPNNVQTTNWSSFFTSRYNYYYQVRLLFFHLGLCQAICVEPERTKRKIELFLFDMQMPL